MTSLPKLILGTKYSNETAPQQAIAQRLQNAQLSSQYAAEALPGFLVAIKDGARAYALADSAQFPTSIQSDFGRRRLTLARLNAAFKLAVKDDDLDRALGVTMRLAQVVAANSRGDEFIRRSPALAATLGDRDAYRRLFSDRSGWRGARDARLTVAHAFSNELDEAEIHCCRAIEWINWNARQERDERELPSERSGPSHSDFASILFLRIIQTDFQPVDRNLHGWGRGLAIPVAREAIKLARQYECATGASVLSELAAFAVSTKSKSFVLKATLLSSKTALTSKERKLLARSAAAATLKPEKLVLKRDDAGKTLYLRLSRHSCMTARPQQKRFSLLTSRSDRQPMTTVNVMVHRGCGCRFSKLVWVRGQENAPSRFMTYFLKV